MAKEVIPLRETEPIFRSDGIGTRRFNRFIREMADVSNENSVAISAAVSIDAFSLIADIQNRLGSGDFLTSDCDSLTVDSTVLFVDQTEA